MHALLRSIVASSLCTVFLTTSATAGLLDFETTPSGATPVDDALLTDPYTIPGGTVRFFFDLNGNNAFDAGVDNFPRFERVGDDGANGFDGATTGVADTARLGYTAQLGSFFLRKQTDNTGPIGGPFIAAYDTTQTIRELSGEIWDIDGQADKGTEQWRVDVLNQSSQVLDSLTSPLGTIDSSSSLDSLPWTFQFHNLPDGVAALRLTFIGSKTSEIGLAFNNFSPTVAVPEPSSIVLATIAGVAFIVWSYRSFGKARGARRSRPLTLTVLVPHRSAIPSGGSILAEPGVRTLSILPSLCHNSSITTGSQMSRRTPTTYRASNRWS